MTMNPPIIMHVNYCEQGQSLDDICRKAVDWGFDGVEFRRKRSGVEEEPERYLDALASATARAGLKQVIFGSPGPELMTPDDRLREAELAAALRFYELAAERFKLTICNTFAGALLIPDKSIPWHDGARQGSAIATKEHWEWAVSGFKTLGAFAEARGFRFAFETHDSYLHDLPAAAKRLVDWIGSPSVGVTLDYANIIRFPVPPSIRETIALLGSSIFYVHLKNLLVLADGQQIRTSLADGQINSRELLRCLKESGYDGPLCIEAPRAGDREWFAQQDVAYLRSLLKDLNW